ncbi:IS66 family insertion sequence element accessory protein TnpA [Janthinobacterium sp. MDT1-19]|uniref:IS66 family insertion sequence element accessory protein TnpA n=1 Tax=Janthinobacterium sp. MDT1-19 TaxID=1259339 RepID=UPI003F232729
MSNKDRQKVWKERVAQWQASGLSQRAYAIEQGFPIRQVGYWIRRLTKAPGVPGLLPVRVAPAASVAVAISLRNERGWTLSLPGDVPASWLAELMRAL